MHQMRTGTLSNLIPCSGMETGNEKAFSYLKSARIPAVFIWKILHNRELSLFSSLPKPEIFQFSLYLSFFFRGSAFGSLTHFRFHILSSNHFYFQKSGCWVEIKRFHEYNESNYGKGYRYSVDFYISVFVYWSFQPDLYKADHSFRYLFDVNLHPSRKLNLYF